MKCLRQQSLETVHTHTHTQVNELNRKNIVAICGKKYSLLIMSKKE